MHPVRRQTLVGLVQLLPEVYVQRYAGKTCQQRTYLPFQRYQQTRRHYRRFKLRKHDPHKN